MTTTQKLLARFATNGNFSAGPDVGTPTKTDPNSNADGFVNGTLALAQHVNFQQNALSGAARRAFALALCKPRLISGVTLSVPSFLAAVSRGQGAPITIGSAHSGGVPVVGDEGLELRGVLAAITGATNAGAWHAADDRLLVVGNGGNHNCSSLDQGANWTAGGALGGVGLDLVYNPSNSSGHAFVAGYNGHIKTSANGVAWAESGSAVGAGYTGQGFGMLPNGNMFVLTGAAPLTLSSSTTAGSGGFAWASGAAVPPNAADFTNRGSICGAGLDNIYHAGKRSGSDNYIQVSASANGTSWSQVAEFAPVAGRAWGVNPKILQCVDSGALWLVASNASPDSQIVIYCSLDAGATWTEPVFVGGSAVGGFSAAGGRLFCSDGAGALFGTDGVGWE